MGIEESLLRLRSGEVGFEQFVRETRSTVRAFMKKVARRWGLPVHVEVGDLEQEFYLEVLTRFAWEWDPGRTSDGGRYIRFNGVDKAKKALHKARNAKRRTDHAPSRLERPFSSLAREGEEGGDGESLLEKRLGKGAWVDPDQDDVAERRLALDEAFRSCRDEREAFAVAVLAEEGDVDLASRRVAAMPGRVRRRVGGGIKTPEDAKRFLLGVACDIAGRKAG